MEEYNKKCVKCGKEKEISNFSKKYKTKNGIQKYQTVCKECVSEYDKNNKRDRNEYYKSYYEDNKEVILNYKKEYHIKNRDIILEKKRIYRWLSENRERNKNYIKNYKIENKEKYYLYRKRHPHIVAWRRILYRTLEYLNKEKQGKTIDELGYSSLQLKEHIESLWVEGMSWENYGEWEIDHIKPLTKWEETSLPSEVNALSNLQPLWKEDNIKKYNNYKEPI